MAGARDHQRHNNRERTVNANILVSADIILSHVRSKPKRLLQSVRQSTCAILSLSISPPYRSLSAAVRNAQYHFVASGVQGSYPQRHRQQEAELGVVSACTLNAQTTNKGKSRPTEEQWDPDTKGRWFCGVPPHSRCAHFKKSLAEVHIPFTPKPRTSKAQALFPPLRSDEDTLRAPEKPGEKEELFSAVSLAA